MTDQDNRDLCEAVGWKYLGRFGGVLGDVNTWRNPFGNIADAIAALEAWRAKSPDRYWEVSSPDKDEPVLFGCLLIYGDMEAQRADGTGLPAAACKAILAAWRKMKESK